MAPPIRVPSADALENRVTAQLIDEYKQALKEIRATLADTYAKYEKGGKLTYSEMAQYGRLSQLNKSIENILVSLGSRVAPMIKQFSGEVYQEGYYRMGWEIVSGANLNISWGMLSTNTILASVEAPVSGLPLSERLTKTRYELLIRQRQTITQGLIQGKSYGDMAKSMRESFEISANDALRIVRTEASRNSGEGEAMSMDYAEEQGIEIDRVWDATLDSKTRPRHASLDGQKADEEGYFHSGGLKTRGPSGWGDPAMDINCRCTIREEVKDFPPEYRREGSEIVKYRTYYDWATAHGWTEQYGWPKV